MNRGLVRGFGLIAGLTIVASFWKLDMVISALLTSRILTQFVGQIAALHYLRKHRPDAPGTFRMWLYPLPAVIALAGWMYIFATSGWQYAAFGLGTLGIGMVTYSIWAARRKNADAWTEGAG